MTRSPLLIGGIGLALLAGVWLQRPKEPKEVSDLERIALMEVNDPKLGVSAPSELDRTGSGLLVVVYLPECTECTKLAQLPTPLPTSLSAAVFVKRTSKDVPKYVQKDHLWVDSDGSIDRALNAVGLPRIYVFKAGKLTAFQRVGESCDAFLERVRL
jgi:hypothetical protein